MNKINPFILVGVIFVVFVVVFIKASHTRSSLPLAAKAVLTFEEKAKRVSMLEKMWNKDALENRLKALFVGQQVIDKGNMLEIKSTALTRLQANEFIRKALAEAFEIKSFDFVAEGDDSYRVVMEIKK
ncbi:MAG: hypothetical protein LBF13_00320 [Campylobacteraceae bacterium]|jgi:hypothetical protein|nr:hypothetical protein [Campylobacteraceae bacterium]